MTITKRVLSTPARLCTWVFGAALLATAAVSAQAQAAYPAKPIRLIVPFPPGGGTDMIARSVAQKITEKTSWNIVVDNRPGAGGEPGGGCRRQVHARRLHPGHGPDQQPGHQPGLVQEAAL